MSALHCAQLLHIILHITYLLIFALTLQTIIIAPMMSVWGKGDASHCNEEQTGTTKFWFVVSTLQVMVHKTHPFIPPQLPWHSFREMKTSSEGGEGKWAEVEAGGGACASYSQWLSMSQQVLCQTDRQTESNRNSSSLSRRKTCSLPWTPSCRRALCGWTQRSISWTFSCLMPTSTQHRAVQTGQTVLNQQTRQRQRDWQCTLATASMTMSVTPHSKQCPPKLGVPTG